MDLATYAIFPTGYGWTITRHQHIFGVYPTREQAIEVACLAARAAAERGVASRISLLTESGETESLPVIAPAGNRRRNGSRGRPHWMRREICADPRL
jgi:hypothetical protein